jgi:hypothetical protein
LARKSWLVALIESSMTDLMSIAETRHSARPD